MHIPQKCVFAYEELLVPKLRYNILSLDGSGCHDMQATTHHYIRGSSMTGGMT